MDSLHLGKHLGLKRGPPARALDERVPRRPRSWGGLWASDDGSARSKLNVQSLAYHRHSLTVCTCRIPFIHGNDRTLPAFPPQSSSETEPSLSLVLCARCSPPYAETEGQAVWNSLASHLKTEDDNLFGNMSPNMLWVTSYTPLRQIGPTGVSFHF